MFKLIKQIKPIFPRMFYYSFSIGCFLTVTITLLLMFMSSTGVVGVYENILPIRIAEILICLWLLGYTMKMLKRDIGEYLREGLNG